MCTKPHNMPDAVPSTRNTAVNIIHKIPVRLEFASQMLPRRKPDSSRVTSNSGCLAVMKQWTGLLHTLKGFLIQRAHSVGHQLQVSSYSHFSLLGWTPNQDHPWECSRGQANPIRQGEHPFPCAGNSGPLWPGVWNDLQARHQPVLSPEDGSGTEHSGLCGMGFFESNRTGFLSQLFHMPTGPRALPSLSLSFLVYKRGLRVTRTLTTG